MTTYESFKKEIKKMEWLIHTTISCTKHTQKRLYIGHHNAGFLDTFL